MTVAELLDAFRWKPIPHCPGRFALPLSDLTVSQLVGNDTPLRECRSPLARDPVVVAALPDGGLISYRQDDDRYLHTLNTPEGFERKLRQLGLW